MINLPFFLIIAVLASASFSVLFNVSKENLVYTTLSGTSTALIQHILKDHLSVEFATFISTLYIGVLGHTLAKILNTASQPFIISGIIFLVPGTLIYSGINKLFEGNGPEAFSLLISALLTTSSISFALLVANWLIPRQTQD